MARALVLAAALSALLRAAGQAPPPPPPPLAPAVQCSLEAEAAGRARDAAVRRWHDALQLEQTAHRFEADVAFYEAALQRNASEELPAWRNATAAELAAELTTWRARRAAAEAEVRAAAPAAQAVIAADCDTSFSLSTRPLARLKPALYPLRPNVTFILQYFRQPAAIEPILTYFHSCTRGMRGVADASSPLWGLTSEFVAHVDSGEDAAAWAAAAAKVDSSFVTLVVSPNVHEIRGYNRGAAVARGDTLVLLQDDDTPSGSCDWLANVTHLLRERPLIGAVALKKGCIVQHGVGSCNWAWQEDAVKYFDPSLDGMRYQYVTVADFAPLVLRAAAYADVGGCDEGAVPPGESGILLDYELSLRLWAAGWHVTQLHVPCLKFGPLALQGGTAHGISLALRGKNQALNSIAWQSRFHEADHFEVALEVRRKNAALAVVERHREALERLYNEREAALGVAPEERARVAARLAAFAAARDDPGVLPPFQPPAGAAKTH